jgi:hypothetical protein
MSKNGNDYGTRMYKAILKQNMSRELRNLYENNPDKMISQFNKINLSTKERGNVKIANYGNRLNFDLYNGFEEKKQ